MKFKWRVKGNRGTLGGQLRNKSDQIGPRDCTSAQDEIAVHSADKSGPAEGRISEDVGKTGSVIQVKPKRESSEVCSGLGIGVK